MTTITAGSTTEITLSSPAYVNPVVVASGVTISSTTALGIYGATGPWTIQNFGSVAGANLNLFQSAGIWLQSGGAVTNEASASISDQIAGIVMYNGIGSIINDGSIAVTNPGNQVAWGVRLDSGGSVTNAISASITAASASGSSIGVEASRGGATVVNFGSIGAGGPSGQGIGLSLGGYVTNASGGRITGSQQGIVISAGVGTVVNGGQIVVGPGAGGIGIQLVSGGSVRNAASASIVSTGQGISIAGGAGTVINNGYIGSPSQAVTLPFGYLNRLVVSPGAKFEGIVNGGNPAGASSVSTLELASGTSLGTLTGLGSQFTNFSSIVVDPGSQWFIDGGTAGLAGIISGFSAGDTIKIDGVTSTSKTFANGILSLSGPSGVVTLHLPGNFNTNSFLVSNGTGGAYVSIMPRTLSWIGGNAGAAFGTAANWDDVTDGQDPALSAPTAIDTVEFNSVNGGVTGSGTVAAIDVAISGDGAMDFNGGSTLVAGSLDVGVAASASGQIGLFDAGTKLLVTGAATVGDAGTGMLSVSNGANFTAASLMIGSQSNIANPGAAGGDGVISVSGTGSALTLSGSLTVGNEGAGEVSILNGATVGALDVTIGNASTLSSGNVDVEGAGSELVIGTGGVLNVGVAGGGSGVLTIGAGTTLQSLAGVVEAGHASFNNNGGVVDPPFVDFTGSSNAGLGSNLYDLYVENIGAVQIVSGTGTWDTPMMLTGTSVADASNNLNDGDVGEWQLSSGGTLIVNANTVDSGQAIVFEDATDTLVIGQIVNDGSPGVSGTAPVVSPGAENLLRAGGFAAEIWGYVAGDTIEFGNMTVSSASVVNGNTMDLFGPGNVSLGSLAFFTKSGSKASDAGAAAAAAQVGCFAAGSRIETVDGPVAVEHLRVGDRIATADGSFEPIVWIGRRAVNCRAHPAPETVWPVRVKADAFGDNIPARDLYLSPDHGIFVSNVLVPVKHLINGTSIVQVERDRVIYFHVELPEHTVILAERLPVESYLDIGDRAGPETVRVWETRGAAPLVTTGASLERARRAVKEIA